MPPLQSGRGQTRSKTIYHVPINPPPHYLSADGNSPAGLHPAPASDRRINRTISPPLTEYQPTDTCIAQRWRVALRQTSRLF